MSSDSESEETSLSSVEVPDSNDEIDDEDDYEDERCFSPRTRMSITGIRPSDLTSSDEDEDENKDKNDSHDELDASVMVSKKRIRQLIDSESEDDDVKNNDENQSSEEEDIIEDSNQSIEEVEKSTRNSFIDMSAAENTIGSLVIDTEDESDTELEEVTDKMETSTISVKKSVDSSPSSEEEEKSTNNSFIDNSVAEKTIRDLVIDSEDESDAEVKEIINKMETSTISINGSDDVIEIGDSPVPPLQSNYAQPKIQNAFSNVKVKVSGKHFQAENKKLDELQFDLQKSLTLQQTLNNRLSDSGEKMNRRVSDLKLQILKQKNYIATLEIQETIDVDEVLGWDDIKKMTTDVKPVYTGKVGMKNFENQKSLTLERLKSLHSSLEGRPTEDILVATPKGILVELMPHQMHGLAWMLWREKQRPRGGILADDMGLGKTLTIIALIIETNNREKEMEEEEKEEDSESESDEDDEKHKSGWAAKGRRDYYYGNTLIVCPASLINQWEGEIKKRTKRNLLSVEVYHGSNRESKPRRLAKNDIVITTYNIVSREAKEQDTLFQIKFDRVVLDEAHQARNHKSKTSEGVCLLKGKYRWALTGTPIQNKEMDLFAILKFLKCTPFNDLLYWKRWIDQRQGGKERLHTIVQTIMLRRTKDELQERKILEMPSKTIQLVDVTLDKEEMNVYQKILIYSKTLLGQYLHQKAEKDNDRNYYSQGSKPTFAQVKDPNGAYYKAHEKLSKQFKQTPEVKTHQILSLLLRLRQICCHPGLIDAMLEDDNSQTESGQDDSQVDLLEHLNKLNIEEGVEGGEQDLDSSTVDRNVAKTSARCLLRSNPVFSFNRPSAKIRKVLELVETILKSDDKIVIVSQWTGVLEILGTHLETANIKFVFLTGKVLVKDRNSLVNNFNNPNTEQRIMLLSLTAGGVGLNLIGANHLMLLDLHWNPQLESQAQDRIYRVGQKKPVNIYKLMCLNTVEERIKALQEHKLELASAVLTGKARSGAGLSMEDLRNLFNM